jgi:hypothetical protein
LVIKQLYYLNLTDMEFDAWFTRLNQYLAQKVGASLLCEPVSARGVLRSASYRPGFSGNSQQGNDACRAPVPDKTPVTKAAGAAPGTACEPDYQLTRRKLRKAHCVKCDPECRVFWLGRLV